MALESRKVCHEVFEAVYLRLKMIENERLGWGKGGLSWWRASPCQGEEILYDTA